MLQIETHVKDQHHGWGVIATGDKDDVALFKRVAIKYFENYHAKGVDTGYFLQGNADEYCFIELWSITSGCQADGHTVVLINIMKAIFKIIDTSGGLFEE